MHEILIGLKEVAPAAITTTLTAIACMTWAFACYVLLLVYVMPKVQDVDVSGWVFAGPLTLSVANLIMCASYGIGDAKETLVAAGVSIAAILTSVVGLLLAHKSVKAVAARPPAPVVPTSTTLTLDAPAASPPPQATATATVTTEPAP